MKLASTRIAEVYRPGSCLSLRGALDMERHDDGPWEFCTFLPGSNEHDDFYVCHFRK